MKALSSKTLQAFSGSASKPQKAGPGRPRAVRQGFGGRRRGKIGLSLAMAVTLSACASLDASPFRGSGLRGTPAADEGKLEAASSWRVIGEDTVFLVGSETLAERSASPLVLEVALERRGEDILSLLAADRRRTGEGLYVLAAEPFSLKELFAPRGQQPMRRSFRGVLWRGAPESGSPIAQDMRVEVRRILGASPSAAGLGLGPEMQPRYLLFGDRHALYALRLAADHGSKEQQLLHVRIVEGLLDEREARQVLRAGQIVGLETAPSSAGKLAGRQIRLMTRLANENVTLTVEVLDEL